MSANKIYLYREKDADDPRRTTWDIITHIFPHSFKAHIFVWQTGLVRVNVVIKVVVSPFGIGRKSSIGRVRNRKVEAFLLDDVIVGQLDSSTCRNIIRSKTKFTSKICYIFNGIPCVWF